LKEEPKIKWVIFEGRVSTGWLKLPPNSKKERDVGREGTGKLKEYPNVRWEIEAGR
jgi:hypothetical protein